MRKIAIRVGYSFNLFSEEDVSHIQLKVDNRTVEVEGVQYKLHSATTFEQSQKVDVLLDENGELPIKDYII